MERFALSQFTTPLSLEEDIALCRRLDIPAIELCGSKLASSPKMAVEQLEAVRDAGLRVCSVQSRIHAVFPDQMASDPADPEERADVMIRTMDLVADALPGENPAYVLISGRAPQHNLSAARETLLAQAERLTREAAAHHARLAFEPLHPVMMNTDSFICTWADALTIAQAIGHAAFGLVCDLWNVWDQPDILTHVAENIDQVALIHASDWRDDGPRRLNDRLVPGRGIIPFEEWGRLLHGADYKGWVALEMLSDSTLYDSYLHEPLDAIITESRRYLEACGCLPSGPAVEK